MSVAARIARIISPTGTGSGCLIAPRLVLTSAHVVPEPGGEEVSFFTATDEHVYTGRVVWRGTPHGRDDAALVEITDPVWPAQPVRMQWGRLVTDRPGTPCRTWGYPNLVQREGRHVETAQLLGTINPGTRMIGDRYAMDITSHPPYWDEKGSPWGGLSGAALMCEDLLMGVVATDPVHRGHAALEAVPAYVLHHDPTFRTVLDDHGVPQVLEPVELAHLDHRPGFLSRRLSPASLLEAHRQVVAFHGRDELIHTLLDWCVDDEPVAAVVVHGPGGQGKTRLAYEFTKRLSQPARQRRWATVWVTGEAKGEELTPVKDVAVPLLLVVDYAESRTAQLTRLFKLCDRPPGRAPIRLLLLTRTVSEWWEQVNTDTNHLLADVTQRLPLPPLAPLVVNRQHEYRTALTHVARALPSVRTPVEADWHQVAADLPDPNLSGTEWGTVLSVHMRALADLLDATQPSTTVTPDTAVEGRVLAHEYRYWSHTAAARGLSAPELEQPLRDVLAAAFTLTTSSIEAADALVGNVASLGGQTTALKQQVRRWIIDLYPQDKEGEGVLWGRVQPDRLLEYFLGQQLLRNPDLFDPLLGSISAADAERLVALYARAAAHPAFASALAEHLTGLCERHTQVLGTAVIEVATHTENPAPLVRALEQATVSPEASLDVLMGLHDALPHFSQRLAAWTGQLVDRVVEILRALAEQRPDTYLPRLAIALNNQAVRLGSLGSHAAGLDASTEAVRIHHALAKQRSGTHLPDFAMALSNQAIHLGHWGRYEEALEAITQAIHHYRALADQHPSTHLPALAMATTNQATRLRDLGLYEEALEAIAQAVHHYRTLAEQHPDNHLPGLAGSLNNQAIQLRDLGRHEEALEAITQAAHIRQKLAEQRPDAHLTDLAMTLNNQAIQLRDLGRHQEALEPIAQAVHHYRALAEQQPNAYLPDLAVALNNQAGHLGELRRHEEALDATTQAVHIHRKLTEQRPDAHLPGLAMALNNQAIQMGDLGRHEEALEAIAQAVHHYRTLAEQHPDTHMPHLATSLNNQAIRLGDLGRHEEALEAITQAVHIHRKLTEQRPDAHLPGLAGSLSNQAIRLRDLGRHEEALEAIAQAVHHYRTLAEQHPDAYFPGLAGSLNNQTVCLGHLSREKEALEAITEAVDIRRKLAEQHPDAYLPDLAGSLNNQAIHLGKLGRIEEALKVITEAIKIRSALTKARPAVHQDEWEQSRRVLEWFKGLGNPEGD
jgi:tetratricopeptide (TPR) repeat protein